jgi:hypothetical protein
VAPDVVSRLALVDTAAAECQVAIQVISSYSDSYFAGDLEANGRLISFGLFMGSSVTDAVPNAFCLILGLDCSRVCILLVFLLQYIVVAFEAAVDAGARAKFWCALSEENVVASGLSWLIGRWSSAETRTRTETTSTARQAAFNRSRETRLV